MQQCGCIPVSSIPSASSAARGIPLCVLCVSLRFQSAVSALFVLRYWWVCDPDALLPVQHDVRQSARQPSLWLSTRLHQSGRILLRRYVHYWLASITYYLEHHHKSCLYVWWLCRLFSGHCWAWHILLICREYFLLIPMLFSKPLLWDFKGVSEWNMFTNIGNLVIFMITDAWIQIVSILSWGFMEINQQIVLVE